MNSADYALCLLKLATGQFALGNGKCYIVHIKYIHTYIQWFLALLEELLVALWVISLSPIFLSSFSTQKCHVRCGSPSLINNCVNTESPNKIQKILWLMGINLKEESRLFLIIRASWIIYHHNGILCKNTIHVLWFILTLLINCKTLCCKGYNI